MFNDISNLTIKSIINVENLDKYLNTPLDNIVMELEDSSKYLLEDISKSHLDYLRYRNMLDDEFKMLMEKIKSKVSLEDKSKVSLEDKSKVSPKRPYMYHEVILDQYCKDACSGDKMLINRKIPNFKNYFNREEYLNSKLSLKRLIYYPPNIITDISTILISHIKFAFKFIKSFNSNAIIKNLNIDEQDIYDNILHLISDEDLNFKDLEIILNDNPKRKHNIQNTTDFEEFRDSHIFKNKDGKIFYYIQEIF